MSKHLPYPDPGRVGGGGGSGGGVVVVVVVVVGGGLHVVAVDRTESR